MSGPGERRAAGVLVPVHLLWRIAPNCPALTPETVERLVPYITRYAQTLGITVHAVGGAGDHLHVLYDLPAKRTLAEVTNELQKTTSRFLREVLGFRTFAWHEESLTEGVGPENVAFLSEYIQDNAARHAENRLEPFYEGEDVEEEPGSEEEMPSWLREVLPGGAT